MCIRDRNCFASGLTRSASNGRRVALCTRRSAHVSARTTRHVLHEDDEVAQRGTSARTSIMSQSEKVLRYDPTATDGSGRRLVQYALPGSDFETAESLEADGLIEREFTNGEWTTTRVFAPDDIRVAVWQFNVNEQDRVHGRPLHFPNVKKLALRQSSLESARASRCLLYTS